jgi:hypothetical protein
VLNGYDVVVETNSESVEVTVYSAAGSRDSAATKTVQPAATPSAASPSSAQSRREARRKRQAN